MIFHFYLSTLILVPFIACLTGVSSQSNNSWTYLGCYKDENNHRLLDGDHETIDSSNGTVTTVADSCIALCTHRRFPYAGIGDRTSCYCGQQFPSVNVKLQEEECNFASSEKANVTHEPVLKVYETGISYRTKSRPRSTYLGCYKDTKVYADERENSILKGYFEIFENLTPNLCDEICYKKGFLYFGMTYGNICHCGDQHPPRLALRNERECYQPCPGDGSRRCGGSWEFNIYTTGITDFRTDDGKFIGCSSVAGQNNTRRKLRKILDRTNSPRRCSNICGQFAFNFVGITNGNDCVCMSTYNKSAVVTDNSDDGNNKCGRLQRCPGDFGATCGSADTMQIYKTTKSEGAPPQMKLKLLGCYVDRSEHAILTASFVKFDSVLTPTRCVGLCYERRYPFGGLQNGNECFCGHEFPSLNIKINQQECNSKCIGDDNNFCGGVMKRAVYETGISRSSSRPRSSYIGCYKDSKISYEERDRSILKGYWQKYEYLRPELCDEICYDKGFLYFGLSDGNLCYCGDQRPAQNILLTDDKCYQPCPGEPFRRCGGSWEFSIYSTGISDVVETADFVCVEVVAMIKSSKAKYKRMLLESTNSPKRCYNICGQLKYKYGAVTNGTDCYCFNNRPRQNLTQSKESCDLLPCPGDLTNKCGNVDRFKLFNTFTSETEIPVEEVTETCEQSQTITKGKNVCSDQIIFANNFTSSDLKSWKYTVQIAAEPDYEFVMYGSSSKNIYIRDGKLLIKPTIRSEDHVTSGSISLRNCTGKPGTEECEKTALSFNILPPIESARITTANSFSFRYGTITIKAKLPSGDWIVPDIWLEPVLNTTSSSSSSSSSSIRNKMKLAFVRGNRYLQCDGLESGSTVLESGLYATSDVINWNDTFTKKQANGDDGGSWSSKFHTFSATWTPETILFYIDADLVYAVINDNIDVRDSSGTFNNIWKSGDVDTEVYLSIGVSVGGISNFPDNCYSGGRAKPWRNDEAKALLKFWQDRKFWQNTWPDDNAALQIEDITVRALL